MINLGWFVGGFLALYWLRWIFLKRKEQPVVVPILFTCFFLPKMKLVEISDLTTAGIRPDDFLALLLLIIAIMDPATYRNRHIRRGIVLLILLSAVNILSVLVGRMYGYGNNILLSILMVIRKFEYGSFALTGIFLVRRLKDPYKTFMDEFTIMCVMHVILGLLHVKELVTYIVAGYDEANYFAGAAVSTFNGYYEYGQFLCFACAIFLFDYLRRKNYLSLLMVPVSLVMLYFTNSRSSLIIGFLLILVLIYLPIRSRISRRRLAFAGYGVIGGLALLTLLLTGVVGGNAVGRFETLNLSEYTLYWKSFMQRGYFKQYIDMLREHVWEFDAIADLGYLDKITDWSAAVRLFKWGAALDGVRLHPVLGYGTGVTHVMDGNYIKLLAETGVVGTALWMWFYGYYMKAVWKVRRHSKLAVPLFLGMISILLNALLIDSFESSKPMEMLWFMVGAVIAVKETKASDCFASAGSSGIQNHFSLLRL